MWCLLPREYKKKVNLDENVDEDTIEFNAIDTFIFNKEKTLPLTGEEEIIFPNILLLVSANESTRNLIDTPIINWCLQPISCREWRLPSAGTGLRCYP